MAPTSLSLLATLKGDREDIQKVMDPLNNVYARTSLVPSDLGTEKTLKSMVSHLDTIMTTTFGTKLPTTRKNCAELIVFALNACIVLVDMSGMHDAYNHKSHKNNTLPLASVTNTIYGIYAVYLSNQLSPSEFKDVVTAITYATTALLVHCPELVKCKAAMEGETLVFVKEKVDFATLSSINVGIDKIGLRRRKGRVK